MKPTIEQIRTMCSTDNDRPELAAPVIVTGPHGAKWVAASDGRHALMVVADEAIAAGLEPAAKKANKVLSGYAKEAEVACRQIGVDAIRAWDAPSPVDGPCDVCDGTGRDEDGDDLCGFCDGDKVGARNLTATCAQVAPGVLLDTLRVRALLAALPADTVDVCVAWGKPNEAVVFAPADDDDWFAVIMPVKWAYLNGDIVKSRPVLFP